MNDPIIILCVAALAITLIGFYVYDLSETNKRNREIEEAARILQRERYLVWLRRKYEGDQPHGYRKRSHIDFTGEQPLTGSQLESIKREIIKA